MAPVQSKPVSEAGPSTRKAKRNASAPTPDGAATSNVSSSPKKQGGRTKGSKNITIEDKAQLVELVVDLKPMGGAGWDKVYAAYNAEHPDANRQPKTLRKIWDDLTSGRPPTGNSPMDQLVRRALEVAAEIEVSTATLTLADREVPPPILSNKDEDEDDEDEDDSDDDYSDDVGQDVSNIDNIDWPLTENEANEKLAESSKSSASVAVDAPSLQENPSVFNARPRPRPKPAPGSSTPATPARTTITPAKPPFGSDSAKVKNEPGSTTKGKAKAKIFAVVPSDSDVEVLSDNAPKISAPAKRKPTASAVDSSRLVRHKPETAAGVVRSAAARTRQNADSVIGQMLDSLSPVHAKDVAQTQQANTVNNLLMFEYQQRIQNLERQLSDANAKLHDKRDKGFQLRMELSQAQTMLAMNNGYRYGAGSGMASMGGFGNPFGNPQGFHPGFVGMAGPQGFNQGNNAYHESPEVPKPPSRAVQASGDVSGAYNAPSQSGASAPIVHNPPADPSAPSGDATAKDVVTGDSN